MKVALRIVAGVIIGLAGAFEGANIASGGYLGEKIENLGKEEETKDECYEQHNQN